jgi:HTH-type transcriptional regulator/antitoxin HigA
MNWKIIRTEEEYQKAIARTLAIFHAEGGTKEADELALLLLVVKEYEDQHIHFPV